MLGKVCLQWCQHRLYQNQDHRACRVPYSQFLCLGTYGTDVQQSAEDEFASHTRLIQVKRNGDLKIEGEITQYSQRNKSVSSEGYSAQTELSMTVNVRFTNNKNHAEDFERQFTSTKSYDTTQSLNAVQEELVTQMVKDLVEQIFNATVANW